MGLTGSELMGALATEGAIKLMERKMDDKLMGVIRHVLTAVGAMFVYAGYTDDATWVTVSGSLATLIGFAWSWMAKSA
jgi:homoserine kinase